jgi:cation:H+ antiporter
MFNSLAVIGIAGTIEPISNIGAEVFWRDWTSMLIATLILLFTALFWGKTKSITRSEGLILLLCYITYNAYLIYNAL